MPSLLTSGNVSGMNGKWLPYIYKPFFLGVFSTTDATGDDSETYISRTDSTGSGDVEIAAICTSTHNCGYYYTLVFTHASTDLFLIRKYDSSGTLIETIFASDTTGNGRYWVTHIGYITIDIGVHVYFPTKTGFATGDTYQIKLPSVQVMERNRFYHGGYSTFLRLPYTEDIAFHSELIPTGLENKNITFLLGQKLPTTKARVATKISAITSCASFEDSLGNSAVSLALEWNVKKDGIHASSDAAGSVADAWGGGETWSLGTLVVDDVDPSTSPDVPAIAHSPFSDTIAGGGGYISGENQTLNTTVAGRAGTAAVRLAYFAGIGSPKIHAYNQFWPITIMIS